MLASFWEAFGTILESKCLQKSSEILDAILKPKKGPGPQLWGSARRNARGPGEDYGGVQEPIPAENSGRDRRQGPGALASDLARRPRWGGGALCAFRWAETIFDPDWFDSCVSGVAGAMAVASIYLWSFCSFGGSF